MLARYTVAHNGRIPGDLYVRQPTHTFDPGGASMNVPWTCVLPGQVSVAVEANSFTWPSQSARRTFTFKQFLPPISGNPTLKSLPLGHAGFLQLDDSRIRVVDPAVGNLFVMAGQPSEVRLAGLVSVNDLHAIPLSPYDNSNEDPRLIPFWVEIVVLHADDFSYRKQSSFAKGRRSAVGRRTVKLL